VARIVVHKGPDLWLLEHGSRDAARADQPERTTPDQAPPEIVHPPVPRRTTGDPDVLALATILADLALWCPDPRLRAKLSGAWTIPAAELMLGVRTPDSAPETEWGVRWPALGVVACSDEATARRIVAEQDFGGVTLVHRQVRTIGEWADWTGGSDHTDASA
jgi:hypothetical protein